MHRYRQTETDRKRHTNKYRQTERYIHADTDRQTGYRLRHKHIHSDRYNNTIHYITSARNKIF